VIVIAATDFADGVLSCVSIPVNPRASGPLNPDSKQSSTCLPLPDDRLSRAFPLLSPIRYSSICALGSERFELRTIGLGCQVSTITFLTSVVTIFSTLFGVLVLRGLFVCAKGIGRGLQARRGGYVVYPNEEQFEGRIWVRKGDSWGRWWKKVRGRQSEDEIEEVDDESTKGIRRKIVIQHTEASPLLPSQERGSIR
jgi:hypothetical protein